MMKIMFYHEIYIIENNNEKIFSELTPYLFLVKLLFYRIKENIKNNNNKF